MRLVCLGDSLTYGYPYDSSQSWTAGLKNIGIETYNAGLNGDTTGDMLWRLERDILSLQPTHVTFMGGTNDVYIGEDLGITQGNYGKLLEVLTANKIVPILALMPPVADPSEGLLKVLRSFILKEAKGQKIPILDFYSIFIDDKGSMQTHYFCDDCHPNLAGYKLMTDQAVKFFKKLS